MGFKVCSLQWVACSLFNLGLISVALKARRLALVKVNPKFAEVASRGGFSVEVDPPKRTFETIMPIPRGISSRWRLNFWEVVEP